jgi:WD40 repeat protein
LVRVWDTKSSSLIYEGRRYEFCYFISRGSDFANIHSINFDQTSRFVVVSSDKETVHVFKIGIKRTALVKFSVNSDKSSQCVFLENEGGRKRVLAVYGDGGAYVVSFEDDEVGGSKKDMFKILK